ncbi:zinc ribbon domain-containing protein [Streptomyces zagrosensis]|uniref:Ribosomal protein S27AE/quercetin dioxygenase-like cupin family protein n=1 Tax=Streptomyces zagrosensis TaxID=1042984 RepID=A0A7W9QGP7_9ACTN|nr:zinc ribbon domain-containing protein [Streptomyces zagrosensis]MBB5939684.1 ribosomal protein S27AE/quercetin dioxygenase-like cupin family protein [Streptomyces zagrosensis]
MGPVSEPRVLTRVGELIRGMPEQHRGALWRLSADQRQLDANVIHLPPRAHVAAHLEARLDVLLYVIDGSGHLASEVGLPANEREGTKGESGQPESPGNEPGLGGGVLAGDGAGQRDDGSGVLDGERGQSLRPGAVVWLPHGARRAVSAGPTGLTYLTVHRRRPGLTIGSPAPAALPAPVAAEREGGEAACLLHRVCPACGRLAPETDARYCGRCGTALAE